MPVSQFNFKDLKQYITSSKDQTLHSLALRHGKKYVGSSSSMTSTLAQFHFLLSQWRPIDASSVSRSFSEQLDTFTIIQRCASSVFLRYKDGVYALDATKEFASANVLMSLGKSMEKLLTQKPDHFERYRKTSEVKVPEEERTLPEAYQYSEAGDFLMRAQLDAWDPRLPGTGTFDLKTRAVASIRHNTRKYEEGQGYEIKKRFGDWESYEREYFDMIRSAFLKYSLQVRMGQMDGIFVAFHNVDRIFGFQYVSLPEMDTAVHGSEDTIIGDQEFRLSIRLLNDILNRITERFPHRSLRLQCETRDALSGHFMYVFAEPMDKSKIDAIQRSRDSVINAFEESLTNPPQALNEAEHESLSSTAASEANVEKASDPTSQEPDTAEEAAPTELLALSVRIQNKLDGIKVSRPTKMNRSSTWQVEYDVKEIKSPSVAQNAYRSSKLRQKKVLDANEELKEYNYYVRRLRELTAKGIAWRKSRDDLDAGRQKVTLYDTTYKAG